MGNPLYDRGSAFVGLLCLSVGCSSGGSDDGGNGSGKNGGTGVGVIADAEPRDVGTPLPGELLGEELEREDGKPKHTNTFYDDDGLIGLWIPPGVDEIRGVHLNLLVNPNWGAGLVNQSLDRQMASSWQFAQVAGWNVWQKDRSSSEEGWAAVQELLEQMAEETGHPELASAPVLVSGGSRTGRWGPDIANLIPDRMLGYVTLVAGAARDSSRTQVVYETPGLVIPGEQDKGEEIVSGAEELRSEGANVAVAMMWGKGHTCGPCENVMYPFLDAVVAHRLDDAGNVVPAPQEGVWLGEHDDWTAAPKSEFAGDESVASWLLDSHFAGTWRAFTLQDPKGEFSEPKDLRKAPRASETAAADLTTVEAWFEGVKGEVQLMDGSTLLSTATIEEGNVVFEGIEVSPGIHSFYVAQDGVPVISPVVVALL